MENMTMKKKISMLMTALALLLTANTVSYAAVDVSQPKFGSQLRVVNNWNNTIHVREGSVLSKESDVYSGHTLDWTMFSGVITNLSVGYWKDGGWQAIPGCANGNFYNNLTVYVVAAPWDQGTPICHTA
jgi:hypothetical protein